MKKLRLRKTYTIPSLSVGGLCCILCPIYPNPSYLDTCLAKLSYRDEHGQHRPDPKKSVQY